MADDECIHGMVHAWCATCNKVGTKSPPSGDGEPGLHGERTKQDLLNELCDCLGIERAAIGVGSSVPSHVFEAAATRAGVRMGSMPEVGSAVAKQAGLRWGPGSDSRGSLSGGGSTVTREGLEVVVAALRLLDVRRGP